MSPRSTTRIWASLKNYVTETGKIVPSRITGTKSFYQRQLATAIKRARFLALLPVHRSALRLTPWNVILLQKVANLGNIGDRVKVKSGYGRNYLLPTGKATLATAANVARFEARRAELETHRQRGAAAAPSSAPRRCKDFKLTITAKAGTEGKLFGSVGTADIAEACTAAGHEGQPQRSAAARRSDAHGGRAPGARCTCTPTSRSSFP